MHREEKLAYLSLGSNQGDRLEHLRLAAAMLQERKPGILACSSIYRTTPVDLVDQPEFLNLALALRAAGPAERLLRFLQGIESRLGRQRTVRFGPRTIDLDILFYGREVIKSESLSIPHPRLHLRRFVLQPLCEIAPELRHPVLHLTVREMLEKTPDSSPVERYCGPIA
jgi:2-amino-4-hydroxy-6-hydroxymethyldihydropteridine diphosphokinase